MDGASANTFRPIRCAQARLAETIVERITVGNDEIHTNLRFFSRPQNPGEQGNTATLMRSVALEV